MKNAKKKGEKFSRGLITSHAIVILKWNSMGDSTSIVICMYS
jgi:hypothetical protein